MKKSKRANRQKKPIAAQRATSPKQNQAGKRAIQNQEPMVDQSDDPKGRQPYSSLLPCAERYRIGQALYEIEDYQIKGNHFMDGEPHRRFRVWWNGCSIGQHDTIKQARARIMEYLLDDTVRSCDYAFQRLKENMTIIERLSDDDDNLQVEKLKKFLITNKEKQPNAQ